MQQRPGMPPMYNMRPMMGPGMPGMMPNMQPGGLYNNQRMSYRRMTTTAAPSDEDGPAVTPAPSPWGQPTAPPSGGDDDDEGGAPSTPAPPAYGAGGSFYRQPYGGQRNYQGQGAGNPYAQRMAFSGMQGRSQGGRFPQQMGQFRPRMGQFPGQNQMRSSMMGARGPQYGQAGAYGQVQQRYGQRQQQQQMRNPFAPQAGPTGGEGAAAGGEQD